MNIVKILKRDAKDVLQNTVRWQSRSKGYSFDSQRIIYDEKIDLIVMSSIKEDIQQDGFSIISDFFTKNEAAIIIAELAKNNALQYDKHTVLDFNLIKSIPFINELAHSERITSIVKQILGDTAIPVNAFVIDKTKTNNWELGWHQDLRIAVSNEMKIDGYSDRKEEGGILHAIAPQEVLEKRLSVRIHLDNCTVNNGAMLVIPQSHKNGIIRNNIEIEKRSTLDAVFCEVGKGGVMFFVSLLLHKSPYSISNKKRRVLHIDYVGIKLTNNPDWYNC